MKSTIEHSPEGLRIQVAVSQDKQQSVLDELGKCACGNCACPTPQYEKVSAIELTPNAQGVTIDLKVKSGEEIDIGDIQACLDHSARQVGE